MANKKKKNIKNNTTKVSIKKSTTTKANIKTNNHTKINSNKSNKAKIDTKKKIPAKKENKSKTKSSIQKSISKKKINQKQNHKKKKINNNNNNKIEKIKLAAYLLLICIVGVLLIINITNLIIKFIDNKNENDLIHNINDKFTIKNENNNDNVKLVNSPSNKKNDYWDYIEMPFKNIDYSKLLKINNDTVAFIHLNNTNINYPVVQASDNDFYLKHTFNKSKNSNGWIFMDFRNNSDLTDDNTIIYGHNLKNKTMFGTLKKMLNKEHLKNKENRVIYISTNDTNYLYQVFSIYTIKEETYYLKTNFINKEEKKEWINTIKKRNISSIKTSVDENDKILTLSTCKNSNGVRVVVHAKLIKMQKKI